MLSLTINDVPGRCEESTWPIVEKPCVMTPLEFWFDFASTYSYIAAMRIESLCAAAPVPLRWRPFLLGPIFELQGWSTSHFNLNARRGAYMWRDLERLTEKFDLPWKRPSVFPRKSTFAARIACAHADAPWCASFIRAVFVANFGDDLEIKDEAVTRRILSEVGVDADAAISEAMRPELRVLLRENTNAAMEMGIFGAPNCVVGKELFWGEESLEDAIAWAKRG